MKSHTKLGAAVRKIADRRDISMSQVAKEMQLPRTTLYAVLCGYYGKEKFGVTLSQSRRKVDYWIERYGRA